MYVMQSVSEGLTSLGKQMSSSPHLYRGPAPHHTGVQRTSSSPHRCTEDQLLTTPVYRGPAPHHTGVQRTSSSPHRCTEDQLLTTPVYRGPAPHHTGVQRTSSSPHRCTEDQLLTTLVCCCVSCVSKISVVVQKVMYVMQFSAAPHTSSPPPPPQMP